jgi:hypothetical protein
MPPSTAKLKAEGAVILKPPKVGFAQALTKPDKR